MTAFFQMNVTDRGWIQLFFKNHLESNSYWKTSLVCVFKSIKVNQTKTLLNFNPLRWQTLNVRCGYLWLMSNTGSVGSVWRHLIEAEVESQRGHVSSLAATANVSQLQLEVMPPTISHLDLIQPQPHRPRCTTGHREHQLTVYHLTHTQTQVVL